MDILKKKKFGLTFLLLAFFILSTVLVIQQPSQEIRSRAAGLNLPLVPWEGGPSWYSKFSKANAGGWTSSSFFPIGVYFESVHEQKDIDLDKAAGLNTYVVLTNDSNYNLIRSNGMFSFASGTGSENVGHALADEGDMYWGPGSGAWNGTYSDEGCNCGYTAMQTLRSKMPNDGGLAYANYGKGVLIWESQSQAAPFINTYQDVVSADLYFYTDLDICPAQGADLGFAATQCRVSANYGWIMDKMRTLDAVDGIRKPIYGFVEVGHSSDKAAAPGINGNQIQGAVMQSIIHEARGIIYFNHSFGGSCTSQHLLRDSCGAANRPSVVQINQRIKALAPVLNTQSYQYSFNSSLDTMLKEYSGAYYIFAMQKRTNPSGTYAFTLPAGMTGSSVEVLNENRTLPISGGKFTDSFAAEYSYHIYKLTTGTTSSPTNTNTPAPQVPTATNTPAPQAPTATRTPVPQATATSTPGSTTKFSFDLLLHGIGKAGDSVRPGEAGGGNMDPLHKSRTITVHVYTTNNTPILTKTGIVTFDAQSGSFRGTVDMGNTLTTGQYVVDVKFSQSLQTQMGRIQTITAGVMNTLPQQSFVTGDINNDGSVSLYIFDYNIFLGCYSTILPATSCTADQKVQADLDDNGKVDDFDFNFFIRELMHRVGNDTAGAPVSTEPTVIPTPTRTPTPTPTRTPTNTPVPQQPTGQFLPPAASGKTWQMSFSEEFNGTDYDHNKLTPCFDWNSGSCTSSFNKGREHYLPAQVRVSGGTAKLVAEPLSPAYADGACLNGSCTYKSGLLSTARANVNNSSYLYTYTYGYVESRMKFPAIQGFFTAFWMLPANKSFNYRSEIDILELLGHDPTDMEMHYSYNNRTQSYSPNFNPNKNGSCADKNYSTDFHNIGLDWQPDHIAWYIDGVKCAQFTNASQIENGPMQIILDLMIDHEWQRNVGKTLLNQTLKGQLEVDYIRVFQQK